MNTIKKIFILFLLNAVSCLCEAKKITGELPHHAKTDNRTDHKTTPFYADIKSYVNGGVTFYYPENYFFSEPHVYITLELQNLPYSASLKLSPIVVANTPLSTTVYVNKEIAGIFTNTIGQAATDDVFVHIFAFGS